VIIEDITWDKCGDPNFDNLLELQVAGIFFNITSNILLLNCTFQYSQGWAVFLCDASKYILIQNCNFLNNNRNSANTTLLSEWGGLKILGTSSDVDDSVTYDYINVIVSECNFYNNGHSLYQLMGGGIAVGYGPFIYTFGRWSVSVMQTTFSNNDGAAYFSVNCTSSYQCIQFLRCNVDSNYAVNSGFAGIYVDIFANGSHSSALFSSSIFNNNSGTVLWYRGENTILSISDSNFTNNIPPPPVNIQSSLIGVVGVTIELYLGSKVELFNVLLEGNIVKAISSGGGAIFIQSQVLSEKFFVAYLTSVYVKDNTYLGITGGAVYINSNPSKSLLYINNCTFLNVTSPGRGAALYIDDSVNSIIDFHKTNVSITESKFYNDVADEGIIYVIGKSDSTLVWFCSSDLINNTGSAVRISKSVLMFCGNVLFENNTSDNGGALYFGQETSAMCSGETNVLFVNNTALQRGGAIYTDSVEKDMWDEDMNLTFVNNSALLAGNSIYFKIPKLYPVITNISNSDSILYVPCQFNYSQLVNGTMRHFNCSMRNETGFPIVTVPHKLQLYCGDTVHIPDTKTCLLKHQFLGNQVMFRGCVFDYFGIPSEATLFNVQCADCPTSVKLLEGHILVDNVTPVTITFTGQKIMEALNVTVDLTSALLSMQQFSASVKVELTPCDHPGYVYSDDEMACTCYHHNVHCFDDKNAIKRGYWFGTVLVRGTPIPTTSLCPNHYCNYNMSIEEGYFELPKTINAQCNCHRSGIACGDCNPGYTLSYDSNKCVKKADCSAEITLFVIALTFLYWVVVVVGVFSLMNMFFKFTIPLGYVYGIIYYYSLVSILLNNNPYLSDGAFLCVSILSSFAQLIPQFLGQLCLAKGLDGIDQLFIHYTHALAISLIILFIVRAARCSIRITVFVNHGILRVICLLILLSYTSFSSTSLQLLRPLWFTDIDTVYTYASPNIKYFHSRHAIYGIVAAVCELFIVIGLPLFLLLERFISRKIVVRVMPLLNEFRGCYKDKYRWFAAYYLICRQVIVVIVYAINSNYDNMLFYLQTACVIIAAIHMWVQPYQDESLNALWSDLTSDGAAC